VERVEELEAGDPTRIGPYELTARLGAGGMGQVFLGQSPGGRLVAVKVIHLELARDKEFRARFAREVSVARTVGGFFTVPVVDADTDARQPWLATGWARFTRPGSCTGTSSRQTLCWRRTARVR
jgi:serine/threonine protein kinase